MASLFGGLGRSIGGYARDEFSASPIIETIRRLRQRRQVPQMAGSPTNQGVFAPGVFEPPIPHAPGLGNNAYGGEAGPFGSVY